MADMQATRDELKQMMAHTACNNPNFPNLN